MLSFWKMGNLPFVSGTQKKDQMPMQMRIAPKKKYAPYPKSEIMYGVDRAMMNEPSQVSAVVRDTQSMRMSSGKISEATVQLMETLAFEVNSNDSAH